MEWSTKSSGKVNERQWKVNAPRANSCKPPPCLSPVQARSPALPCSLPAPLPSTSSLSASCRAVSCGVDGSHTPLPAISARPVCLPLPSRPDASASVVPTSARPPRTCLPAPSLCPLRPLLAAAASALLPARLLDSGTGLAIDTSKVVGETGISLHPPPSLLGGFNRGVQGASAKSRQQQRAGTDPPLPLVGGFNRNVQRASAESCQQQRAGTHPSSGSRSSEVCLTSRYRTPCHRSSSCGSTTRKGAV